MLARVSNVEAFRRWRLTDEPVEALVRFITTDEPTEAMRAGTAFHAALEGMQPGDAHEVIESQGFTFYQPDVNIALPDIREMRGYKRYGELTVTGQADLIHGRRVDDHKTTSRFDAERYLDGCQWRFYLDIFDCDVFTWRVYELRPAGDHAYHVGEPHLLTAYRYPEMHEDCARLAADYLDFAREYLRDAA